MSTELKPITPVETYLDEDIKEKPTHVELAEPGTDPPLIIHSDFDTLSTRQALKRFKVAALFCFIAAFSAATDGYQININGNILANKGFIHQFATTENAKGARILDASWIAGWSGIQSLGQLIGMLTIHYCSDRFGRRISMFVLWSILCFVRSDRVTGEAPLALVDRQVLGRHWSRVSTDHDPAICKSLPQPERAIIAELSPNRCRGALLVVYTFWFATGGFIGPLALRELNLHMPMDWRLPVLTQWAQIGIMFICYCIIPETPTFYARRNDEVKGKKAMRRIFGRVEGYDIDKQWDSMLATLDMEQKNGRIAKDVSLREVFQGDYLRRTTAACIPLTLQQFTGLALIYAYSSYFFAAAGQKDPFQTTMIVNSIKLLVIVVAAFISDKVGRRPIILVAGVLCFIGLLVIGTLGSFPINDKIGAVLILFACVWNVGNTCLAAMGFAYAAETAGPRLRNKTASVGAGISVVFGIAFGVGIPYALNANYGNLGLGTAWIFFALVGPVIVAAWFLCAEVANRTPAELDELFETTKAWKFRGTVTNVEKQAAERVEAARL